MSIIKVGRTKQEVTKDGMHRTSVQVTWDGEQHEAWFVTQNDVPFVDYNRGDIWLPVTLMLAMRRGEDLELLDPISAERMDKVEKIQDIFLAWYPKKMQRVTITAPESESKPEPERTGILRRRPQLVDDRVSGTCFTGGADSFNSLVKHKDDVGALIYGFGIDVPLHETEATERVTAQLHRVAESSGKRFLGAQTNIRRFLGKQVSWGFESHGAALASLGTIFSTVVSTFYIPSTHSYAVPFPWGSHPLVDPLWSTDRMSVEHDGAESSRVDKLKRIADDPTAQRNLRVCYKDFSDTNCGRCMKCMRTMATLTLLDRMDKFETFTAPLDVEYLKAQTLITENDVFQIRDAYEFAKEVPGHEDIREAFASLIEGYREREAAGFGNWQPGDPLN